MQPRLTDEPAPLPPRRIHAEASLKRSPQVGGAENPQRIMFVLGHYGVGGAEKQLANLILHRPPVAEGLEVHTLTMQTPTSAHVTELFEGAGAINTLVDRNELDFTRFFLQIWRTMRRINPVLVSTILSSSVGTWGRLGAILAGVPLIVHSDRQLDREDTRAHRALRGFLDGRTDRFLPNAQAIAESLVQNGIGRERISVVPNGVDLTKFDPLRVRGLRDELGIPPEAVILGYLGRFADVKRLDVLLAALQSMNAHDRPDRVLLAGEGPTLAAMKKVAAQDPWLRDNCVFLGATDETPEFLATLDYLVLPSESEGFPNVVLEAMAMRKPVVSTRVSDIPLMIGDSGFIAEPSDVSALAAALTSMQRLGPAEREVLAGRARKRVEERYSIQAAAERFWEAHLSLLESHLAARKRS